MKWPEQKRKCRAVSKTNRAFKPDSVCPSCGEGYVSKGVAWVCRTRVRIERATRHPRHDAREGDYWRKREENWRKAGIKFATRALYLSMYDAQRGHCFLCGKPAPSMGSTEAQSLHMDHDHETGQPRALLCGRCNHRLLGKIESPIGRFGITRELWLRGLKFLLLWEEKRHEPQDPSSDG